MKNIFVGLLFILMMSTTLNAQKITGIITDERNQPLAYATIFVEDLKTGTVSNAKGEFSINLEAGNYRLRFQYLGYHTKTQEAKVPSGKPLTVQLKKSVILLNEVVVRAKGEDPAYNIIRKAIAKAPFHENQLAYYRADIYCKDVTVCTAIPKIVRKMEKAMKDTFAILNEIYSLTETVYEITHTPKETKQIATAINEYVDSTNESMKYVSEFQLWNVYSEDSYHISPLSRNALSYYNYELVNTRETDGKKIHHIRITPKKKSPTLVSGTIDIIDYLWCVYHLDITIGVPFFDMKSRYRLMYSELENSVWYPVSCLEFANGKALGFGVETTSTSSIRYLEHKVNSFDAGFIPTKELAKDIELDDSQFQLSGKYKKMQDEIVRLSEKDELSKKDMLKLMNLVRKGVKELKKDNGELFDEKSLEVELFKRNLLIDAKAYNRSAAYWNKRRIVPLTSREIAFINKIKSVETPLPEEEQQEEFVERQQEKKPTKKQSKPIAKDTVKRDIQTLERAIDSIQEQDISEVTPPDTLQTPDTVYVQELTPDSLSIEELLPDGDILFEIFQTEDDTADIDSAEQRVLLPAASFLDALTFKKKEKGLKKHTFHFLGYKINFDTLSSLDFSLSGTAFNPVDGLALGVKSTYTKTFTNQRKWTTYFDVQYAFASEHFPMQFYSVYEYAPRKMGFLSVTGGRKSLDFNKESGINDFMNQFASLVFKQNYVNYYDSKFMGVKHGIEAFNGFYIGADFYYEEQNPLHNTTNYSFFYKSKEYRSNTPEYNPYVAGNADYIENNTSTVAEIQLYYTPQQSYTYIRGRKVYLSSSYPSFSVSYRRGIVGAFGGSEDFEHWEATVRQNKKINKFSSFDYFLCGGIFTNNRNMHFSNFKHFGIYESVLMNRGLDYKFHTLKTYSASTNEWYLSGFLKYKTAYLLLKHLPFLESKNMNENIYVSYLRTPELKNYMETGYALTDILGVGNVGFFVGINNFKYNHWGIRFSLDIPVKEVKELISLF